MVVEAGRLPAARRRRAALHAAAALVALAAVIAAGAARSAASRTVSELEATERALGDSRTEADKLAAECGIQPFSGDGSLDSFPMKVGAYPSPRVMHCARRVGRARAELIDLTTRVSRLRPAIGETAATAASRTRWALVVVALWAAGLGVVRWRAGRRSATARAPSGS